MRNVARVPELQVTRIKPNGVTRRKFFFVMIQSSEPCVHLLHTMPSE